MEGGLEIKARDGASRHQRNFGSQDQNKQASRQLSFGKRLGSGVWMAGAGVCGSRRDSCCRAELGPKWERKLK